MESRSRRARARLLVVPFAALLLPAAPAAWATCGSSSCFLVTGTREGIQPKGRFTVDLDYQDVNQSRKLRGSKGVDQVLVPAIDFTNRQIEPDHHREIRTHLREMDLHLVYGLTERLSLVVFAPVAIDREAQHFDRHDTHEDEEAPHADQAQDGAKTSTASVPSQPAHIVETFRQNDGTTGFGDLQLGLRYGLLVRPRDLLIAGASLKLPTGPYKKLNAVGEINETTIQPGTGSTDAILSLHYSHQFLDGKVDGFAAGSFRRNGTNDLDYAIGDEQQLSLGGMVRASDRVGASLQLNVRHTGHDEYIGDGVPSTGVTYVNLTPGIRLQAGDALSFHGFVQLPMHQRVNESQLAPRTSVLVGLSRNF